MRPQRPRQSAPRSVIWRWDSPTAISKMSASVCCRQFRYKQVVAADDSVLGVYSRSKLVGSSEKGLVLPYAAMVSLAFQPQWWATTDIVEFDVSGNYRVKDFPGRALRDNEYAVAEFNFSHSSAWRFSSMRPL